MDLLVKNIERITGSVGIFASFALVPLVLATCYEVFARYAMGAPTVWAYEVGSRSKANVAQSVELLPARVGHTGAARESSVVRNQGSSYSAHLEQKLQLETVMPNPSFKRTRSGSAGWAFISFWAKPALPPRAAQLKR